MQSLKISEGGRGYAIWGTETLLRSAGGRANFLSVLIVRSSTIMIGNRRGNKMLLTWQFAAVVLTPPSLPPPEYHRSDSAGWFGCSSGFHSQYEWLKMAGSDLE
jgi:hypothetical protein